MGNVSCLWVLNSLGKPVQREKRWSFSIKVGDMGMRVR